MNVQGGSRLQRNNGCGQPGQGLVPGRARPQQQIATGLDEVGDRRSLAGGQAVGGEVIDHQDVEGAQRDRGIGDVVCAEMDDAGRDAARMDGGEIVERA
ncbi:MAG: hypothetical protein E6I24_02155 [Chloroflexi bacterium]|nr:MAG: hypothetical protein E6I24_02155 [Chloroflexota bacterium]